METVSTQIELRQSAGWYAEFIDNLPVAIYRTTIEGKIVYCNKALAEMFGFRSVEELIDYPVIELYGNKKDRGSLVQAVLKRGTISSLPFLFRRRDGRQIWCAVSAKAVFDDDGMMVLLDGFLRDITTQMQQERPETLLGDTANTMHNFVVLLDTQGHLLDINEAGMEFMGLRKEELLGRLLQDFIIAEDRDILLLLLSDLMKTGREESILRIEGNDGKEGHFQFDASLSRREGSGNLIKGILRNVTGQVREERERMDRERFQGVLEMAGGVAHRLNQPLMIINNLVSEIISDLKSSDRNYERIMKVHHQIEVLNGIGKKIAGIKKYEPMDYVAGVRIVDLDRAS